MIHRSFLFMLITLLVLSLSVAGATAQVGTADLIVDVTGPISAAPGEDIDPLLTVQATNQGTADAPGTTGTIDPASGYMVDLILSTDEVAPEGFATPGPYHEDVLLAGGRISNTPDIPAGNSVFLSAGVAIIPVDTPPGSYFVCARIDPGAKVAESNEGNNTNCWPIEIEVPGRTTTHNFLMDGPDSVPFVLFNVLTEGTVQAVVTWTGDSAELTATLTGRRRPALPDPTAPYAQVTSTSPMTLTYTITTDDLARGVGWRLALTDPAGVGDATGTIELTAPFVQALDDQFQGEKISLRSGDLWPDAALQAQFLGDLAAAPGEGLHALISLTRACNCNENKLLERAGLFRQSFLPGRNSFGFIRKGVNLADPDIVGLVRAITPLEPEDKMDPHILLGDYSHFEVLTDGETPANTVLNPDGSLELSVLLARDVAEADILAILGAEAISFDPVTDYLWQVTLDPASLAGLAAHDEVEWIDAGPAPQMPDNNNTRAALNVNAVQNVTNITPGNPPTITYGGLTGAGITAGVQDRRIDAAHPDLNVVATIAPAALGSHGTHVAGILAGSGGQSSQNNAAGNPNGGTPFQWRGMAPQAGLISSGDLDNGANLLNGIQNNSLDLVNRSQSVSYDGQYDAENQVVDSYIRGGGSSGGTTIPRRPHVYSAGNHGNTPGNQTPGGPPPGLAVGINQLFNFGQIGYFSLTKQMKNVVIVGNWNGGTNRLSGGSSLGPAYDGRIKPDVVAPGTNVISTSTISDGSCNSTGTNLSSGYVGCSGTSMASPAVAGVVALLLQGWQNTYSTPLGTTIDASPPLPSTIRALLIQTATDINPATNPNANNIRNQASADVDGDSNQGNGNNGLGAVTATAGPDYATGWGMVNAQAAVNLMQDFRLENGVPVPNRMIQDAANQGQINEYDFVVDQAGPLQVTLAWDDVEASPANPATNPMLVNDLDLELVAPDGTVFYPWQLGHTILDAAGNPLANNAQPPGTNIQIQVAITPINNPQFTWQVVNCPPGSPPGCTRWAAVGPGNVDYVPACALNGAPDAVCPAGTDDAWVATTGKDHLNNVEQVSINVPAGDAGKIGHWKVRVIGFNVQSDIQDYSVVGFPYPPLPELVAFSDDKVGIPALDQDITFTWSTSNIGPLDTGGTFEYQILLSDDFYLGDDVVLADSAADAGLPSLGSLAAGATASVDSTIQISQANVDALLGAGSTLDDLLDADVFLLVRVDSADEILEHNETNIAFVQLARLVDVVMVMDRSGSMSGDVPVSSGSQTKLQILQDSANLFLDLLRKDAGDRLGQVSFSTHATVDFDAGTGQVVDFTSANLDDAQAAVNALEADGRTNIREALQDGLDLIPAGGNRRKVIVFFSDGMKTAGGDPTAAAFLQQFDDEDIKVFSVGFGTEGGSGYAGLDMDLLETLANVGDHGFFHVTQSATGLDKFFVNAVAGAVDAAVIVDPIADIGAGATHTVDLGLGNQDAIATLVLTWDNPAAELALALRGPSGTRITEANAATFGDRVSLTTAPAYKLMTVHFPVAGGPNREHGGTWRMEIHNPGGFTVRYSASAIAESTVRAGMSLPQPPDGQSFNAGDVVNLQAALTQHGGAPISNAVITVIPNVPLVGLGNLLSSGLVTEADLARIPTEINGEELSLQERMVMALQEILGRDPLPSADGDPFQLTETETPGTYSSSFSSTRTPGPYTFTMRATGLVDQCQPVQREFVQSVSVRSEVDPGHSRVVVVSPGGGLHTVVVAPFDDQGNYIGPGYAGDIVIAADLLAPTDAVVDQLDGSYTQDFTAIGVGIATVQVTALGVALPLVAVDTGAPIPGDIIPPGGVNDGSTVADIQGLGGNIEVVTGASLVLGRTRIPLGGLQIDTQNGTATAQVPAGLTPGLYEVIFETQNGQSSTSGQACTEPRGCGGLFRVVGRGQDFPATIARLRDLVDQLLQAQTNGKGLGILADLLQGLREVPVGPNMTQEARRTAVEEAARLLAEGRGLVTRDDIPAILAALNVGKIDARFIPYAPTDTRQGQQVLADLDNNTGVLFGKVIQSGGTRAELRPGSLDFTAEVQGNPHMAYDIITTAGFDPGAGIEVEIRWEEGDFPDEAKLRLYHQEGGQWVDRTVGLDTTAKRIRARVTSLSEFVIAAGPPRPSGQAYLPLVLRNARPTMPPPTPTLMPMATPTRTPTGTRTPTSAATSTATSSPTASATRTPTDTPTSTASATRTPTGTPTSTASATTTSSPTSTPTVTPTHTRTPTPTPSSTSTPAPTNTSTATPTHTQTPTPSSTPTPVTITLTPVADAYIYSAAPATNYGTATTLYAGSQSTSATGRALLRFDLKPIPAGATVQSATFQAYLVQSSTTPALLDIELKRIDAAWQEMTVTWNTQPPYTGANNVAGVGTAPAYYAWDVTSLVQTWANGATNNGLALMSKNESTLGWRGFASRESTNPPKPPRLVVTYRP